MWVRDDIDGSNIGDLGHKLSRDEISFCGRYNGYRSGYLYQKDGCCGDYLASKLRSHGFVGRFEFCERQNRMRRRLSVGSVNDTLLRQLVHGTLSCIWS